ncbi:hypothetical protein IAD21_01753 [Abditibacteriota bacterium]|nr:hypothetical protein IAD21_01753 [Abditibacteriota bacterium]
MFKKALNISTLILILLLGLVTPSFAGGKAEPLPIPFKTGSSTATVKGHITGDLEFDYAVATKKGQWIMAEVVSDPLDSATFIIRDPQGSSRISLYRWSGIAPETGDYEIWVSKPADYKTTDFTLKVTVGMRPAPLRYSPSDKEGVALYAAMRKFINAFRTNDRTAFLACFSKSKPSYHLNPQNIGSKSHYRTTLSYSGLAADVKQKKGWYWTYLERGEDGDMDAFIDNVPNGTMWTRTADNKFVPPGSEVTSSTYVKWRKEGTRWVIDEISYSQA